MSPAETIAAILPIVSPTSRRPVAESFLFVPIDLESGVT